MHAVVSEFVSDLQQMLTFNLDSGSYGVDIQRVQEIRGWSTPRLMPEAPAHVLGVLDLRGTIVPVIDLRARIGLPGLAPTATTVIIVLGVAVAQGLRLFGIVVDGVSDVSNMNQGSLRAVPPLGGGGNADYLRGLVHHAGQMVLVLDIDRLLGDEMSSF